MKAIFKLEQLEGKLVIEELQKVRRIVICEVEGKTVLSIEPVKGADNAQKVNTEILINSNQEVIEVKEKVNPAEKPVEAEAEVNSAEEPIKTDSEVEPTEESQNDETKVETSEESGALEPKYENIKRGFFAIRENAKILWDAYNEKMKMDDICTLTGMSKSACYEALRKLGMPLGKSTSIVCNVAESGDKVVDNNKTMRGKFTAEQFEEMAREYQSGKSTSELGFQYDVHKNTIRRYLKNMGIELRDERSIPHHITEKLTENEKDAIDKLFYKGYSLEKIANDVGVSESQVKYYLKHEKMI